MSFLFLWIYGFVCNCDCDGNILDTCWNETRPHTEEDYDVVSVDFINLYSI